MTPTHFFGELTKTPEGCMYLREKGLVGDFAEIVRLHGMEHEDAAIMTNVKSVLWVLVRSSPPFGSCSESLTGRVISVRQKAGSLFSRMRR